ncbi:polysaccharide deacetylase family protein [Bacillus timonensis]|nr:polysaccharide deacetylase family protein [Bacillus timonensis]
MEYYKENLLGVRVALPEMLRIFKEYNIHATWATVGFLFFEKKEQLLQYIPQKLPTYEEVNLSPYQDLNTFGNNELEDPCLFGASLLELIKDTPNQEIGTHTFSHYYCLEPGQTIETFKEDLEAALRVAKEQKLHLKSLVFPRNQVNEPYLEVCKSLGLTVYRGNEPSWIYQASNKKDNTNVKRAVRLLDAYVNIAGHHTYALNQIETEPLINIRSSRFLRPYSKTLSILEPLRLRRIKQSMTHAAKKKEVFHLWWHPHNFGINVQENIKFLEEIFIHFKNLQQKYGMESMRMGELAEQVAMKKKIRE